MTSYKARAYTSDEVIRAFSPEDIARAEQRYNETNDPAFIALAIGASPVHPPDWAVQAAIELSHEVSLNYSNGLERDTLGKWLDRVIVEYCALAPLPGPDTTKPRPMNTRPGRGRRSYPHSSLDALIRKVLNADKLYEHTNQYAAARTRIIAAWYEEEEEAIEIDGNGMPMTPRFRRVALGTIDPNEDRSRRNSTLATWIAHRLKQED